MSAFDWIYDSYTGEWGYMDPQDFNDLETRYVNAYGGESNVLDEGALLDAMLLLPGANTQDDLPVVLAIPVPTTTWTSTYKVRAWRYGDEPKAVWDYLEAVQQEYPTEDEYTAEINRCREILLEG